MHNDTPAAAVTGALRLEALLPPLALAAMLGALVAPLLTPGLVLLLAGPLAAMAVASGRDPKLLSMPVVAGLASLGIWLAINSLWSVDRSAALGKVALFWLLVGVVSLAADALPRLRPETADRLGRAVLIAVGAGTIFLALEVAFDQPMKRLAGSLLPFLRPPAKHATTEGGWVTRVGLYTLNRNLALLVFMLWPSLLLLRVRAGPSGRVAGALLLAATAIAVFRSEHETSMLALLAGVLVLIGMHHGARLVRGLVLAGWLAATLLVVPLAAWSYAAGLHQTTWLPQTARNRVILWGVTADKFRAAPILGVGIDSTKPLDEAAASSAVKPEGYGYPLRTGRHSHNIFLQTWYELGAVGAVLLLAAGVLVLGALARQPSDVQPYAYASFASACVIGAFSWGMWQPWFMAAFAIWALVLLIAFDAVRRQLPPARARAG